MIEDIEQVVVTTANEKELLTEYTNNKNTNKHGTKKSI